jgi:hypothetical protein
MNRRQRRAQLKAAGMLRVKNMYGPFTEVGKLWYNKTREEGVKLHAENTRRLEVKRDEYFANLDARIRESYKEAGYSDAQIELMMEAWILTAIKSEDTYRADRKKSRELLKEAAQMK